MEKEYWYCIIGPAEGARLPSGCDAALRDAVQEAFRLLVGRDAKKCYTSWGITEATKEQMLMAKHSFENI